jgi:hypothetical protein
VVAALLSALGAVILGEYPLEGFRPVLAGLLFGVTIAEVLIWVARTGDRHLAGTAALLAEAGLVWATWISTAHDLGSASATAWLGIVVGAAAAGAWVRSAGRRRPSTPDGPAPAPAG